MKNYLILSALLAFVPAAAKTSLGDYRQAVTEYSWELKVAASKSDAASQTMGQARTGYLPRLSRRQFHRHGTPLRRGGAV